MEGGRPAWRPSSSGRRKQSAFSLRCFGDLARFRSLARLRARVAPQRGTQGAGPASRSAENNVAAAAPPPPPPRAGATARARADGRPTARPTAPAVTLSRVTGHIAPSLSQALRQDLPRFSLSFLSALLLSSQLTLAGYL